MAVRAPVPDEERLVSEHLGLVRWYVARHPARNPSDNDDMLAAGTEGLLRAIRTFDPELGVSFGTYAHRCIANMVGRHLRSWYGNPDSAPGRRRRVAVHVSWDEVRDGAHPRRELIADPDVTVEADAVADFALDPALDVLDALGCDERHKAALRWLAEGRSRQWVCRALGIHQSLLEHWLRKWRRSRALHDALRDAA